MSFTGWWKSRHSILKSRSLDNIDEINAGKIFKIRYIGCTNLDQNEECNFNRTADGVLNNLSSKTLKKLPALELFIDSKSLSVTDKHFQGHSLLEVSLSDVRDILYRKKDSHYGKICIFVARHIPLSSCLKAHVLYCDTYNLAEELFETFRCAFEVFNQKTSGSSNNYCEIPTHKIPNEIKETTYTAKETLVLDLCDINDNGLTLE